MGGGGKKKVCHHRSLESQATTAKTQAKTQISVSCQNASGARACPILFFQMNNKQFIDISNINIAMHAHRLAVIMRYTFPLEAGAGPRPKDNNGGLQNHAPPLYIYVPLPAHLFVVDSYILFLKTLLSFFLQKSRTDVINKTEITNKSFWGAAFRPTNNHDFCAL